MTAGEPAGVSIRRAAAGDWPGIRRLVTGAGLPLDGLGDSHAVFVAERAGRIVGTAAIERHGQDDTTAFLLRSVAVEDAVRGSGIGARLVDRVLSEAGTVAPVALLTGTAADYFPRFGFVPVDRTELPASLSASPELRGACPASARALLLRARRAAG
jgi:amino-acid N-acetyltransferase